MTDQEIIEMAKQAPEWPCYVWPKDFIAFARLITKKQRERDAGICNRRAESMAETIRTANPKTSEHIMLRRDARLDESKECAAAILAQED